ncbi:MAG: acylphosphatase [Sulfolobales archaeon]
MLKRAVIRLYGIVQGVGMRYFIWREAKRLGLNGYVRNLSDGSVEIVAEGDEELIQTLVSLARKEGPGFVSDLKIIYEPFKGDLKGFKILH